MGHACGRHRVARLMREAGLRVRSRKRWRLVSSSRHALPIAPNHLDRQFASDRANRHWVSDMTYVRTAPRLTESGRRVRSLFTRRRRLGDAPPHAAGFGTRRAGDGRCTPTAERRGAAALRSWQSILRVRLPGLASATSNRAQPFTSGNCWDNAAMESFFRSLKADGVYLTRYASYQEAKTDLFDYIRFYNHRRRHSTLGYLSPTEFERRNATSLNYLSTSSGTSHTASRSMAACRNGSCCDQHSPRHGRGQVVHVGFHHPENRVRALAVLPAPGLPALSLVAHHPRGHNVFLLDTLRAVGISAHLVAARLQVNPAA